MVFPLNQDVNFLAQQALTIRRDIVTMLGKAGSGHTGGSLSCTDILTVLYFAIMNHDPENPRWEKRDRFILSKGHAAPAQYAVLAAAGYFSRDQLNSLRKLNSMLQGHPDMNKTPGIEVSTGSLGQGISMACGMAMGLPERRIYTVLGDGECQEGQVWEAAMSAAHYKLNNLCAIIDNNGLQIDGEVCQVMSVDPLADKWKAFGWHVITVDGHDYSQLLSAFEQAEQVEDAPCAIIAKTIKGKGVSFTENQVCWHGVAPNDEQVCQMLDELK